MQHGWRALFLAAVLPAVAGAADLSVPIKIIKAVGPEGTGNTEAAAAWKELSRQGPDALVPLLAAVDSASPVAANYLRSAIDAVAERATAVNRPLPARDLEAFL